MEYKIISANAETGQIQVTYYNLDKAVATFAIDIPIVDGSYITGQQLETLIQAKAPVLLVERNEAAKTATGFDAILAQVAPIATPIATPTIIQTIPTIEINRVVV